MKQGVIELVRWCRIAEKVLLPVVRVAQIAFLIIAALVVWSVRDGVREVKPTLTSYGDVARSVQPLVVPTSQNVNAILLQAGIASGEMAQASIEQRKYWQTVSEHTIDAIGDAQDAIKNWGAVGTATRAQIDPIFARFNGVLDRTDVLLGSANDQVIQFGPLLSSGTSLVRHVDGLVSDPFTHETLANFRSFTGHADLFMADVQHVTHRFVYPPKQSLGRRVLGLLPIADRLAQFGYYSGAWR